jgi:hypothetical protein
MQNFPEQARMWQQIQHANQLRPTGADMNQQQSNAQVCFSLCCFSSFDPSIYAPVPPGPVLLCLRAALLTTRLFDSMLLSLLVHPHLIAMPSRSNGCRTFLTCPIFPLSLRK